MKKGSAIRGAAQGHEIAQAFFQCLLGYQRALMVLVAIRGMEMASFTARVTCAFQKES